MKIIYTLFFLFLANFSVKAYLIEKEHIGDFEYYGESYAYSYYPDEYRFPLTLTFSVTKKMAVEISNCSSKGYFVTYMSLDGKEIFSECEYAKGYKEGTFVLTPGNYTIKTYGTAMDGEECYIDVSLETSRPEGCIKGEDNPINIGNLLPGESKSHIVDTYDYIASYNNNDLCVDIFYYLSLLENTELIISNDASFSVDIELLDTNMNLIKKIDNANLKTTLRRGDYYVVIKNNSQNDGILKTEFINLSSDEAFFDDSNYCVFQQGTWNYNHRQTATLLKPTSGEGEVKLTSKNSIIKNEYFDGLGRPFQTVQKEITRKEADLVTYYEYDDTGRGYRTWLPTPIENNKGSFVSDFNNKAVSYYNDNNPYNESVYETSPLNRVIKSFGPGDRWHSAGKGIETSYLTNTNSGVFCVTNYEVSNEGILTKKGIYNPGELFVEKTTDEDGNPTYTFTDKIGQMVLSRQINKVNGTDQYHDTYIVYDSFGNKRYVLPPMIEDNITQENLDLYAYTYKYDKMNRCIEKKLPGCEPIRMIYDMADRLVMAQTGNQKDGNVWLVNKYDKIGRLLYTSEVKVLEDIEQLREDLMGYVMVEKFSSDSYGPPMENTGYSRKYFDVHPTTLLTVNYYDDYEFLKLLSQKDSDELTYKEKGGYGKRYKNAKGMLTGTRVYDLSNTKKYTVTSYYYDDKGQEIQVISTNHLEGYEKNYYKRSFTGVVQEHLHEHTANGKDKITEIYKYDYDHAQRLLKTIYQLNDNESVTLSENDYNELGLLKSQNIHGGKDISNYKYNIRGWLTDIAGKNLAQTLRYNDSNRKNYYNGNISEMILSIESEKSALGLTQDYSLGFEYDYDGLSRLVATGHTVRSGLTIGGITNTIEYDKHGNIIRLQNLGLMHPGIYNARNLEVLDDLIISHNGNQLKNITDLVYYNDAIHKGVMQFVDGVDEDTEYEYDANGNLIKDLNQGISTINYNILNLPKSIYFDGGYRTDNHYDASGRKYQVKYLTDWKNNIGISPGTEIGGGVRDSIPTTIGPGYPGAGGGSLIRPQNISVLPPGESIGGGGVSTMPRYIVKNTMDYCGNIIYKDGKLDRILTSAGYVDKDENNNFVYHYYIRDYQGNNRVVMNQDGGVDEINHYSPQGVLWSSYQPNGPLFPPVHEDRQPYKYNGKQIDRMYGLNWYDYSSRWYNSVLNVFTSIDSHAENYYHISPYAYCGNNPIKYIDPDGMDYWSTNDPRQIERFLNSLKNLSGPRHMNSFDYSGWTHVEDDTFVGNLTYNDETKTFLTSYGYVVGDEVFCRGISIKAAYDNGLSAGILTSSDDWYEKASGRLNNFNAEFEVLTAGVGATIKGAKLGIGLAVNAFKSNNFRKNLIRLTGHAPTGAHAHHIFPQRFRRNFARSGINIHDPRYGVWWEKTDHLKNAYDYNEVWRDFFNKNSNPSKSQILEKGRSIMAEFGIPIIF